MVLAVPLFDIAVHGFFFDIHANYLYQRIAAADDEVTYFVSQYISVRVIEMPFEVNIRHGDVCLTIY